MRTVTVGQRRRGTELEQAILRATADEMAASGYAGMTMDKVAQSKDDVLSQDSSGGSVESRARAGHPPAARV